MFNFINGIVLPLLAAALIPLLLHLLNRRKLKVIPFSSLRFLKELQNKRLRQIKLYQILIILIRMLFVIFLVLAFSRPALRLLFSSQGGNARTTAVIILDNSYSMQSLNGIQSAFDQAKQALNIILKTFNSNDAVTVLSPQGHSVQTTEINPNERANVPQWKVSNASPDFSQTILTAAQIFAQFPNYNRELYFLSDNRLARKALNDSAWHVLKKLKVHFYFVNVSPDEPFDNVSIDTAYIQSHLIELNKPLNVSVTLFNHSSQQKQTTVNLFDDKSRLSMELVTLPARSKRQVQLHFSPNHTKFFPLQIEIDDDDLMADNAYYLSLFIPNEINILYVQNRMPVEIHEALNTLSEKTNLKIKQTDYAHWYGEPLAKYRLLALNDPPQITTTFLIRLEQFLSAEGDIILIPGLNLSPTDYNHLTKRIAGKNIFKELIKANQAQQFFSLKLTAEGRDLLADVFQQNKKTIAWPDFFQYFKLLPCGKPLLLFTNNNPFLCRLQISKQSGLWLFAANISTQWSNFPFNGLFIPFLHQIFSLASNEEHRLFNFTVESPISVYLNEASMSANFQLSPPKGEPIVIIPKQTPKGLRFNFDGFDEPGHYKIFQGTQLKFLFSVNRSQREWETPYIDFSKVRKDVVIFKPSTLSAEIIKKARVGRELWPYFLALALLMLVLEMFLIRKLEGKPVEEQT